MIVRLIISALPFLLLIVSIPIASVYLTFFPQQQAMAQRASTTTNSTTLYTAAKKCFLNIYKFYLWNKDTIPI